MTAVETIISILPKDFRVLDVGALGLLGENTTQFLVDHFGEKNVIGICTRPEQPEPFLQQHPDFQFIIDDFYVHNFEEKFDLLSLDLNIEKNLEDWSSEGLEKLKQYIKPGGYLLNYIMTTTEYGDPLITPHLLRKHWATWWKQLPPHPEAIGRKIKDLNDWELIVAKQEERRPYIIWVLLKLK